MQLRHATTVCAALAIMLVVLLVCLGSMSLSGGDTNDSGAIQGFIVGIMGSALAIAGVLLMPLIASLLMAFNRFTRLTWSLSFFATLCVMACLTALAFSHNAGFELWLRLATVLLGISILFLLPFAALWLRLAGSPPNISLQADRER